MIIEIISLSPTSLDFPEKLGLCGLFVHHYVPSTGSLPSKSKAFKKYCMKKRRKDQFEINIWLQKWEIVTQKVNKQ